MGRAVFSANSAESFAVSGHSSSCSAESNFRELDDVFLQTQTKVWLGEVLYVRLDEEQNISDLLADGELLLEVSNVVWKMLFPKCSEPRHMKACKYQPLASRKRSGKYLPYSNVDSFLKICKILGIAGIDLFSPSDVVEKRNTRKVCMCIRSVSKKARSEHLNVPDFDNVTYTPAMPTDMVDCIKRSLEQSSHSFLSSSSSSSLGDSQARCKENEEQATVSRFLSNGSSCEEHDEAESNIRNDQSCSPSISDATSAVNPAGESSPEVSSVASNYSLAPSSFRLNFHDNRHKALSSSCHGGEMDFRNIGYDVEACGSTAEDPTDGNISEGSDGSHHRLSISDSISLRSYGSVCFDGESGNFDMNRKGTYSNGSGERVSDNIDEGEVSSYETDTPVSQSRATENSSSNLAMDLRAIRGFLYCQFGLRSECCSSDEASDYAKNKFDRRNDRWVLSGSGRSWKELFGCPPARGSTNALNPEDKGNLAASKGNAVFNLTVEMKYEDSKATPDGNSCRGNETVSENMPFLLHKIDETGASECETIPAMPTPSGTRSDGNIVDREFHPLVDDSNEKDEFSAEISRKKSGRRPKLGSVVKGIVVFGVLFLFLHLRRGTREETGKKSNRCGRDRREKGIKISSRGGKNESKSNGVYPAENLKLRN